MKKRIVCFLLILLVISTFAYKPQTTNVFASDYDAKAYLLMDYNTNTILLNKNETEHLEVASMVKLMTSLITIEKIQAGELSLDQKVMVSEYAASMEGSQAFLDANHEYRVEDLLKSVIVASANDSSVVLAEAISGSEDNFVTLMNEKAKELGMNDTLYSNATGLEYGTQYSCAKDIATLLKEEIKHKLYFNYSKIWIDEIVHDSGRKTELVNTNILTRKFSGCDIGKTGFTDEAGYCLSASALKNNMRLISVVIGAKTTKERFDISSNLLNYGFANFENKLVLDSSKPIENSINLKNGKENNIEIYYQDNFNYLSKKGENNEFKFKYELPKSLKAPIKQNDKIGKVYVVLDGTVVGEIDIITKKDYNKMTYKDNLNKVIDNFSII